MDSHECADNAWQNERVAFTGRLSNLTREQAHQIVLSSGGCVVSRIDKSTTVLVVGSGNLPLNRQGRPTRQLQQARMLRNCQTDIRVIDERQFLEQSRIVDLQSGHQRFTLAEVEQMAGDVHEHAQRLLRGGLLEPTEIRQGVPLFSFSDIRLLIDLGRLCQQGVRTTTLRRGLQYLKTLLPSSAAGRTSLAALEAWGQRLVLRGPDGRLQDDTGQLHFDFDEHAETPSTTVQLPRDLYAEALACEAHHDLPGAVRAYQELLIQNGPDADTCFQLANAHFAANELAAAATRFRQAVELEPDYTEAWNNLGNVLALLGQHADAVEAYQQALLVDPHWTDARFGLADVLDECGRSQEANMHWRRLLADDPEPDYAAYAQQRLARG